MTLKVLHNYISKLQTFNSGRRVAFCLVKTPLTPAANFSNNFNDSSLLPFSVVSLLNSVLEDKGINLSKIHKMRHFDNLYAKNH